MHDAHLAMIDEQLRFRGIRDPRVLRAFEEVPRDAFVPPARASEAFKDAPVQIGSGQTISQPYVVAATVEALELAGHERVLDVGTGSGYAAAILAKLCAEVFSIERHAALALEAERVLFGLGFDNVRVRHGDGMLGWPEEAPFDAIAVAAAAPEVPPALLRQLSPHGRLVMPVGPYEGSQLLTKVVRVGPAHFRAEVLMPVRFVPLLQGTSSEP